MGESLDSRRMGVPHVLEGRIDVLDLFNHWLYGPFGEDSARVAVTRSRHDAGSVRSRLSTQNMEKRY